MVWFVCKMYLQYMCTFASERLTVKRLRVYGRRSIGFLIFLFVYCYCNVCLIVMFVYFFVMLVSEIVLFV